MLALITWIHVLISLVGIATGFPVVFGFLFGRSHPGVVTTFLVTTIATSVTGFFFPVNHLLPSHIVGALSLVVLAVAVFARHGRKLQGAWNRVFVIASLVAFYFNLFVAVVQSFLKIPALKAMAPTQSEPPFKLAQLALLVLVIGVGIFAVRRQAPKAGTT